MDTFTVDIMSPSHAGSNTGKCLKNYIWYHQHSVYFFDILKSKWPTLDLSLVALDQSNLTDLEPVDVYERKAIESLHYLCTDESA